MTDLSQKTIRNLFEKQIRKQTMKSCGYSDFMINSFDMQFSDSWM